MWLDLGEYHGPSRFHAFVRYAIAKRRQRSVELAYRVYVTESLRYAPQGMAISKPFLDSITPREDFDPDQVIERVLSVVSDGSDNEPA